MPGKTKLRHGRELEATVEEVLEAQESATHLSLDETKQVGKIAHDPSLVNLEKDN